MVKFMNYLFLLALLASTLQATKITKSRVETCNIITNRLPELGVNQDEITCDNVDSLMKVAKSDRSRLDSIIKSSLAEALKTIEEFESFFDNACTITEQSQFDAEMQMRPHRNENQEIVPNSPEFNEIISEKFQNIEHYIQTAPSNEALLKACYSIDDAYDDLICYMEWAQSEIETVWIENYLGKRNQELKKTHDDCFGPQMEKGVCKDKNHEIKPVPADPNTQVPGQEDIEDKKAENEKKAEEEKKNEEDRQKEIARQKAEEERQAEIARQKAEEERQAELDRKKAEEERQAEIARQKAEEERQAEIARQKAEEERQAGLDRKKAEEERQAEIARQKAEEERQAEIARQKAEEERQAELDRQRAEEERKAEIARQKAEEERQAEIARQKAEEERQAELDRQKAEEERQAEIARQKAEEERQAEIARQKAEEERQAELDRQRAEEERQAEIARQKAEEERQAEIARRKAEEEKQAELDRKRAEEERQAEIARQKAEEERKKAIQEARDEKIPVTLDSVPDSTFPSSATLVTGVTATSQDKILMDNEVIYIITLNKTVADFTSCPFSQYALYDKDLYSPTTAVFQNSYFEASASSFGFSVSDGSGNQRQYTIGSVTGKTKRIDTGGKPITSIVKTADSLTTNFIDGTSTKIAIETNKAVTALAFNIDLYGLPVVGFRACLQKLAATTQQIKSLQFITAHSHVTFDGADF